MGSLGTIPESHARTVGKKQLTAWIKEGLLEHRPAEKLYALTPNSVVSSRPAMEAAFCSAVRVTLVGSTTPAFTRSSYSPVATL
jgi:hypothetical protein